MNKAVLALSGIALVIATTAGAQESIDASMIARIRAEGLQHSQVMEVLDHLVNVIGPRLTASPAYKTAVDWCRERLVRAGFDNVHLEPWEFGRGWQLEKLTIEMVEPRYQRINVDAMKRSAVVMATVLYDAAMRDAMIPRSSGK